MTDQEKHNQRVAYFNSRYWKIAHYPFVAEERIRLCDHEEEADRRCRFCGLGDPPAKFEELAHGLPDFLGNLSIISMNECDGCNDYFGKGCEDHLSKATMLHRTLAGIPRKKGPRSTFKSNDESLRIDAGNHKVDMRVHTPHSVDDLVVDGELPEEIPLQGDTRSQPYIPIQAATALVKIACSICPKQELAQCQGAIDWVRGRRTDTFSRFPVSFAFTPGVEGLGDKVSHVILLRRKDEGPEPYLWSIVQFRNFRFQVAVPFCPADGGVPTTTLEHYPSMFPPDWPHGPTQFSWLDWAGAEKVRTPWNISHRRVETISITRPGPHSAS
jgi:hypothetical protein